MERFCSGLLVSNSCAKNNIVYFQLVMFLPRAALGKLFRFARQDLPPSRQELPGRRGGRSGRIEARESGAIGARSGRTSGLLRTAG